MNDNQPVPDVPGLTLIPSDSVAEAERAALTVDGDGQTLRLHATDGSTLPYEIPVVDENGRVVGVPQQAPPPFLTGFGFPGPEALRGMWHNPRMGPGLHRAAQAPARGGLCVDGLWERLGEHPA